jgi:hypothetical protein
MVKNSVYNEINDILVMAQSQDNDPQEGDPFGLEFGSFPTKCIESKSDNKKYANRSSPPFPANCCKFARMGDYLSSPDSNGVFHWKKYIYPDNAKNFDDYIKQFHIENVCKPVYNTTKIFEKLSTVEKELKQNNMLLYCMFDRTSMAENYYDSFVPDNIMKLDFVRKGLHNVKPSEGDKYYISNLFYNVNIIFTNDFHNYMSKYSGKPISLWMFVGDKETVAKVFKIFDKQFKNAKFEFKKEVLTIDLPV